MKLAEDFKKLGEDFAASYGSRIRTIGELVSDTHDGINGFRRDRQKMAKEQAQSLAAYVKELTEECKEQTKQRQKDLQEAAKEVKRLLKEFRASHAQMSEEQAERLEQFLKTFRADMRKLLGALQKGSKERRQEVAQTLERYDDEHEERAKELHKTLTQYVKTVHNETKRLMGEYHKASQAAHRAWQELCSTMQKTRAGEALPAKSQPGLGAREQKILSVLKENPAGMTLAELGYALDLPSGALGKTLQHVVSGGQIKKEKSLYLPATD